MTPISTIITPLLCAQIDRFQLVRTIKLKVGLHSKKIRAKKSIFCRFFFLGALTLPPQNTDTNMKEKNHRSSFYMKQKRYVMRPLIFACFFPTHDIEETKR